MTPPKASSPGPEDDVPPARPRSEVLVARRTVRGCCNRHADNMACDCLANACNVCNGTGQAMNKEAQWEYCIWCRGRRKST